MYLVEYQEDYAVVETKMSDEMYKDFRDSIRNGYNHAEIISAKRIGAKKKVIKPLKNRFKMAKKRIFRKRTRRGTAVTTTYVPKKKMSKKVKNWSYATPRSKKGSRSHVVQITTTKVFKNARTAMNYRKRAK